MKMIEFFWVHFKYSIPVSVGGYTERGQAVVGVLINHEALRQFEIHLYFL